MRQSAKSYPIGKRPEKTMARMFRKKGSATRLTTAAYVHELQELDFPVKRKLNRLRPLRASTKGQRGGKASAGDIPP